MFIAFILGLFFGILTGFCTTFGLSKKETSIAGTMSVTDIAKCKEESFHATCEECGEIGHKEEMITEPRKTIVGNTVHWSTTIVSYHKECYKKRFNVQRCPCGKGWISNKTKIVRGKI